jgi:hypothetical protein
VTTDNLTRDIDCLERKGRLIDRAPAAGKRTIAIVAIVAVVSERRRICIRGEDMCTESPHTASIRRSEDDTTISRHGRTVVFARIPNR